MPADEGVAGDDHGIVTHLRTALAVAAAGALVTAFALSGWPASEYRHGDLFQYWAGAHALLAGADPYDLAWWTAFHEASGSRALTVVPQPASGPAWTTAYPLWTLAAFVPLALLPFSLASAVWLVGQLAAVGLGTCVIARTVLRTAPRRDVLLLLGIAAGYQPLWLLPGNGNITGYLFGAFAGSLSLAFTGRPLRAGAMLGALLLKPQTFVIAVLALLTAVGPRARWRVIVGGAMVAALITGVSFALRPGWLEGWWRSASALQGSTGSNATLWTFGRATGIPALSVVAPVAAIATLLVWSIARRPGPLALVGAAVPVSVAVAPHGWTYDQLHLLITVAVIVEALAGQPAARRRAGILALAILAGPVPWLLYLVAFARSTEDLSALAPLSLLALLLLVDAARPSAAHEAARGEPRERERDVPHDDGGREHAEQHGADGVVG